MLLPSELREGLVRLQSKLKKFVRAKFVEPENLHFTLTFLGNVEKNRIKTISKVLDRICPAFQSFEVRLKEIVLIPSERFVRVVALKLESEELERIRREVVKQIGGDSKPPHLTLCRVKQIFDKQKFLEELKQIKFEASFFVKSVQLLESKLSSKGPEYSVLHESLLG